MTESITPTPVQVQRLSSQLKFAAKAWREWNRDRSLPADRWLTQVFQENRKILGSRDRKFISGCVHEALRNQTFYDYWIQKFAQSDVRDPVKYAKFICLMGAATDGSVDAPLFAAVWNEIKDQAKLDNPAELYDVIRGRKMIDAPADVSRSGWLALRYSFPVWLVERWIAVFGDQECEALIRATHDRPPFVIRANTLKISREELMAELGSAGEPEVASGTSCGIQFRDHVSLKNSPAYLEGRFEIQSSASQRAAEAVAPQAGESLWDVCAGGGGKTLFFAALMQNQGQIIATDLRSLALKELKARADRAGVRNIKLADVQRFYKREVKEQFDKIVVDAPCSGSGTLGRAPDLKWRLDENSFEKHAAAQLEILEMTLPYLKKSGKLFYMTCSVDSEENEKVAETFLSRHSELQRLVFGKEAQDFRIWPHRENTDGFYMAGFIFKEEKEKL
jgi:16S rRNA (cytosine967-C5)-methyltransferase